MVRLGSPAARRRLRVGYLHLKKAIDEAVGMVSMLDDDGTPAGVDAVLSATMEYGMRRIKDVRQRLNITVAMVPFARSSKVTSRAQGPGAQRAHGERKSFCSAFPAWSPWCAV